MKKYFTIIISITLLFFSCKSEKSKLLDEIDVTFKKYNNENYINDSVLDYYKNIKIDCNNLDELLAKVHYDDQDIRKSDDGDMFALDSINQVKVISILKNCSDLNKKKLNNNSYSTIFLVLQHSGDKDLMAYYYPKIKTFVDEKKLDKLQFSLYVDRFLGLNNQFQIFGTQILNGNLSKFENLIEVESNRKSMGLNTISDYLKNGANRLEISKKTNP